ncbi:hypothetical protein KC338_g653 [Hortaea werneckii]|nr:hypothetical protein KC323_g3682 [Hortaea werneckii]KAI6875477.1 hypothetical protein KC338_g653 [Hortaea werneckii]
MPKDHLEFEPYFVRKSGDDETLMTDEGIRKFVASVHGIIAEWKLSVIDVATHRAKLMDILGADQINWDYNAHVAIVALSLRNRAAFANDDPERLNVRACTARILHRINDHAESSGRFKKAHRGSAWRLRTCMRLLLDVVLDFSKDDDGYFAQSIGRPMPSMRALDRREVRSETNTYEAEYSPPAKKLRRSTEVHPPSHYEHRGTENLPHIETGGPGEGGATDSYQRRQSMRLALEKSIVVTADSDKPSAGGGNAHKPHRATASVSSLTKNHSENSQKAGKNRKNTNQPSSGLSGKKTGDNLIQKMVEKEGKDDGVPGSISATIDPSSQAAAGDSVVGRKAGRARMPPASHEARYSPAVWEAATQLRDVAAKYRDACNDFQRRNDQLRDEVKAQTEINDLWRAKYKFELNRRVAEETEDARRETENAKAKLREALASGRVVASDGQVEIEELRNKLSQAERFIQAQDLELQRERERIEQEVGRAKTLQSCLKEERDGLQSQIRDMRRAELFKATAGASYGEAGI